MMKHVFRPMMAMAMMALAMTACTNDDTLTVQPEKKTVKLNLSVGNYPAAQWEGGVQSRAPKEPEVETRSSIGITDPGKSKWVEGDKLYTIIETNTVTCVTSTYTNGQWVSDDVEVESVGGMVYANTYYAPGFHYDQQIKHLAPNDENSVFSDEFLEANYEGTMADFLENYVVNFNPHSYSRIRIATKPLANVKINADNLYPANGDRSQEALTFTADENGNAFVYGDWYENEPCNMVVTATDSETEALIREEEKTMEFDSKAGQGYVLNLRNAVYTKPIGTEEVIYVEDYALSHEISAVMNNLYWNSGQTLYCINFGIIKGDGREFMPGIQDFNACTAAKYTLIMLGYKFTSDFQDLDKLESISFDAVTEVGERSFQNCTALKEVHFGQPITEWHHSAFENVDTENLVIYLSEDQKELVYDAERDTYVEGVRKLKDVVPPAIDEEKPQQTTMAGKIFRIAWHAEPAL